jgi:nicotinate-nucleotide pyrophosphorylase (carboxylating)
MLRAAYSPCPPIEVECRDLAEVQEAVKAKPERIMLDNMDVCAIGEAMRHIPVEIETEVSGGVSLESIGELARTSPRGPDFISVGRLTHSAPVADFSLKFKKESQNGHS